MRVGNPVDLATAQRLQAGITLRAMLTGVAGKAYRANSASDLYRRTTVAAVQPFKLWGLDRGLYVKDDNPVSLTAEAPSYKVRESCAVGMCLFAT